MIDTIDNFEYEVVKVGRVLTKYLGNDAQVTIPSDVAIIGENAFSRNATIKTLDLSHTKDVMIKKRAFSDCTALESIVFSPGFYVFVGEYAFADCTALRQLDMTRSNCAAFTFAFSGCIALTEVRLQQCQYLLDGAFADCSALRTVELGATKKLGRGVFRNCVSLTEIYLPNLEEVADSVFTGCTALCHIRCAQKKGMFSDCPHGWDKDWAKGLPSTAKIKWGIKRN